MPGGTRRYYSIRLGWKRCREALGCDVTLGLKSYFKVCGGITRGIHFVGPKLRRRSAAALISALFAAILGAEELCAAANLAALSASYDAYVWPW
jgi:hypothetical protein